jgi:hypothetical protein
MSTLITKNAQIGTSGTPADNFTIFQPATPDGTLRIGNGNTGITTGLVTLNSAGNLGLGTPPSAWAATRKVLQLPSGAFLQGRTDLIQLLLGSNNFNDGTGSKYFATGSASLYEMSGGGHYWYTAPSGTAGDAISFNQAMTLDASGNFALGSTNTSTGGRAYIVNDSATLLPVVLQNTSTTSGAGCGIDIRVSNGATGGFLYVESAVGSSAYNMNLRTGQSGGGIIFRTGSGGPERARIDSSGNLLVGKTASTLATAGAEIRSNGYITATVSGAAGLSVNRLASDGELVTFLQATTQEGSISVSGTTVSYNGGHLSRWAQTLTPKDDTLVKGTVLSNLDEMNVYVDADGNPVENEQLNKVKVSDVEGDANVAGVFVNWDHDEQHNVDEINMAMTGDMIIRIAAGTTVARGDLLMSAGNGTAKPQGDDIVRSKTIAKVTSTHVTCTYADGSFCVPCVLMAC